jgi:beta-glucosidase-like glycosyl hydrolase
MEMPDGPFFGSTLIGDVNNGTVPESRVDNMATRILAAWYFVHQDDPSYPQTNFNAFDQSAEASNEHVDARGPVRDGHEVHAVLARQLGAASVVLLKNERCALPLQRGDGQIGRSLALIGSDAGPGRIGPNQFTDQGGVDGILAMGWGSGFVQMFFSFCFAFWCRKKKDCQLSIPDFGERKFLFVVRLLVTMSF